MSKAKKKRKKRIIKRRIVKSRFRHHIGKVKIQAIAFAKKLWEIKNDPKYDKLRIALLKEAAKRGLL